MRRLLLVVVVAAVMAAMMVAMAAPAFAAASDSFKGQSIQTYTKLSPQDPYKGLNVSNFAKSFD